MSSLIEPMDVVRHYIDCFNKADVVAMAADCATPMVILDGMPPHVWHGATATQEWYQDVLATGKREGVSGYAVELGQPWHSNITGGSAYVVFPATMSFNIQGKRVRQSASVFTVALARVDARWKLSSWAWAKGTKFETLS